MSRLDAWVAAALALSCSTDKMPCTEAGDAWLDLPQSRVGAVAEVQTDGVCEAVKPEGSCAAGKCVEGAAGDQRRIVPVHGRSRGSCTVTVAFTDNCPEQSPTYRFDGPLDNCCADVCFRGSMASYAIDACASR